MNLPTQPEPALPPAVAPLPRRLALLVGGGMGLFALASLAAALTLQGPGGPAGAGTADTASKTPPPPSARPQPG